MNEFRTGLNIIIVFDFEPSKPRMGRALFDDIIKRNIEYHWGTENRRGVECKYYAIRTKNEFDFTIKEVERVCLELAAIPLIHIEAHGGNNGIGLESNGKVTWENLARKMARINLACRNSLLVTLAVCEGFYFIGKLIEFIYHPEIANSKAPFLWAVAPTNEISYGVLEPGFQEFFSLLIEDGDLSKATIGLNSFCQKEDYFVRQSCDNVFHEASMSYLNRLLAEKFDSVIAFDSYIAELAQKKIRITGNLDFEYHVSELKMKWLETDFMIDRIYENGKSYLMIDIYEELEEKFRLDKSRLIWRDTFEGLKRRVR